MLRKSIFILIISASKSIFSIAPKIIDAKSRLRGSVDQGKGKKNQVHTTILQQWFAHTVMKMYAYEVPNPLAL